MLTWDFRSHPQSRKSVGREEDEKCLHYLSADTHIPIYLLTPPQRAMWDYGLHNVLAPWPLSQFFTMMVSIVITEARNERNPRRITSRDTTSRTLKADSLPA